MSEDSTILSEESIATVHGLKTDSDIEKYLVQYMKNELGRGRSIQVIKQWRRHLGVVPGSRANRLQELIEVLVRNRTSTGDIKKEVVRRTGLSPKTIERLTSQLHINWMDREATENFVRRYQEDSPTYKRREKEKLKAVHVDRSRVVWQPDALPGEEYVPGKQTEFLTANEDWCDLDGGKGSGKSDLLIFDNLRPEKLSNPRWHGVIFRREYKRLTELISRSTMWLGRLPQLHAHWQGDKSRFIFPSGAWLAFHNVENVGDEEKYQGWEIVDLKFDQLEEFPESVFNYLLLQNRAGDLELKKTVRWTANPGGSGHSWIKRRFVDGKEPGKTHEIEITLDSVRYVKTYRRIHATVFDNPLLKHDKNYIATLASEPDPIRRKAMFYGSWDVVIGQFFSSFASEVHVISSIDKDTGGEKKLPAEWRRGAGLDYGNVKVMEFLARDYLGNVYVEHEFRTQPSPTQPSGPTASQYAELSAEFMLNKGIGAGLMVIGDVNMWSATGRDVGSLQTPAVIIQTKWNEIFNAHGIPPPVLIPVSKRGSEEYRYRIMCNEAVRDFLAYEMDSDGNVTKPPRLFILDRCGSIKNTLPSLRGDPNDPMDIEDGQDDHDYDSLKMPFVQLFIPKADKKNQTAKEIWDEQVKREHNEGPRTPLLVSKDWRVNCV